MEGEKSECESMRLNWNANSDPDRLFLSKPQENDYTRPHFSPALSSPSSSALRPNYKAVPEVSCLVLDRRGDSNWIRYFETHRSGMSEWGKVVEEDIGGGIWS
jgi:hypothetical protein